MSFVQTRRFLLGRWLLVLAGVVTTASAQDSAPTPSDTAAAATAEVNTITGTVVDPSAAFVPGANAILPPPSN